MCERARVCVCAWMSACVCVCVCVRARACVRVCVQIKYCAVYQWKFDYVHANCFQITRALINLICSTRSWEQREQTPCTEVTTQNNEVMWFVAILCYRLYSRLNNSDFIFYQDTSTTTGCDMIMYTHFEWISMLAVHHFSFCFVPPNIFHSLSSPDYSSFSLSLFFRSYLCLTSPSNYIYNLSLYENLLQPWCNP